MDPRIKNYPHAMAIDPETNKPMPKGATVLTGSYTGLSTDVKPTEGMQNGYSFIEVDTKLVYIYHNGQWWEF